MIILMTKTITLKHRLRAMKHEDLVQFTLKLSNQFSKLDQNNSHHMDLLCKIWHRDKRLPFFCQSKINNYAKSINKIQQRNKKE